MLKTALLALPCFAFAACGGTAANENVGSLPTEPTPETMQACGRALLQVAQCEGTVGKASRAQCMTNVRGSLPPEAQVLLDRAQSCLETTACAGFTTAADGLCIKQADNKIVACWMCLADVRAAHVSCVAELSRCQ
jgi:predicted membrane-bound mannosyltransferase